MRSIGGRTRAAALLTLTLALCLSAATSASAVTRSQIIARAKVWTRLHVPYSQSRYATENGWRIPSTMPTSFARSIGYRTDCSGFVSLALNLRTRSGAPWSDDTAGLPRYLQRISKSQLQKGDIILRPKTAVVGGKVVPYGHAVIFEKWANSSKTYYWGLHESSSARGAVRAKIRYGKSGFGTARGFAPYRYIGTRSRPRIERKF